MDTLAFISRYEAILKERKIKKMEFYKMCGISDAAVSQWRKGKTNPTMATIKKIADVLSVSSNYLLTGIGEKKEKSPASKDAELSDFEILQAYNKADDVTQALIRRALGLE